jgi:DNA-binding GntR family transcriptional regulator
MGIRSGAFRPGDRLREAELAAQLNVSRTPIREAIRRLASDGLVEVAPSRGVMFIQLDKQQVRELYALREALEGTAARLAAQHASPDEIMVMHELLERSRSMLGDPVAIAQTNRIFHQSIHDAAHNRYLAQALRQLADSLALLPGTTYEGPDRSEAAQQEHVDILAAIEERDADKAETLCRLHIQASGKIRMRMMFDAL